MIKNVCKRLIKTSKFATNPAIIFAHIKPSRR